ncbi:MAG: DUF1573 domain-containing protein [Ferruginibacter sp.]|nr:DUF1573 domain-containing protein [Ferruginibacter sp.]
MKKIFLLSTVLTCVFFTNAQTVVSTDPHAGHNHEKMPATPAATPTVASVVTTNVAEVKPVAVETLVAKEMEFDFGKIPQGKPVTHIFTVTNSGKVAYKLDNVQASCGCTTPVWDKDKEIAAGKTAEITVGYNAAAEGPFTKPVTITYNGTQTKVITIKGEVWKTPTTSAPTNEAVNDLKK